MKYFLTRMAIPIFGIAFGIFFTISCATSEQIEDSVSNDDSQQFEEELRRLNERIQRQPNSYPLRVQKADLLYEQARKQPEPEQRLVYYKNLRDVADDINQRWDGNVENFNQIQARAWSIEQSSAVRLLQEDRSESYETHFHKIIAHLDNAITIIPDSLVTYSLKAATLYRSGHLNEAINTLESALTISESSDPELKEKLAYIHLESGNTPEAISIYRELTASHPENERLKHGLVNAIMVDEQHEDAVKILRELSEKYPARYNYKESLGTEIYFIFSKTADQLINTGSSDEYHDEQLTDLIQMVDNAHTIFDLLKTQAPANEENTFRAGVFYLNTSIKLAKLFENVHASNDTLDLIDKKRHQFLEYALPYWERLAEINSENMEYMSNLHKIYIDLEMQDDAEAIERTYNF